MIIIFKYKNLSINKKIGLALLKTKNNMNYHKKK